MPRTGSPYGVRYQRERDELLSLGLRCVLRLACEGSVATSAEHHPPLAEHVHVEGSGCCRLLPACLPCQRRQGGLIAAGTYRTPPAPGRSY